MADDESKAQVDVFLSRFANQVRIRVSAIERNIHRIIAGFQALVGLIMFASTVIYLVSFFSLGAKNSLTTASGKVMVLSALVVAAASVGARRSDLPRSFHARMDQVTGKKTRYWQSEGGRPPIVHREELVEVKSSLHLIIAGVAWVLLFAGAVFLPRRVRLLSPGTAAALGAAWLVAVLIVIRDRWNRWRGCWPLILSGLSMVDLLAAAFVFPRTGHPPPAGWAAGLGFFGLAIAVFAFGDRRGRPWVTLVAVITVAQVGLSGNGPPNLLNRIMALLLVVFGVAAVMTSLRHIAFVVTNASAERANAVIAGTGLGLLVAIGGPKLYEILQFGKAADVRNGADAVAASVVASALFFAFSLQADTELRAQLRVQASRADRAEAELAIEIDRRTSAPEAQSRMPMWLRVERWVTRRFR